MEAHRFDAALKGFLKLKPYRPFTIAMVNGDRFEVDHAGALVLRDGTAVYVAPGGVPVIFDHQSVSQIVGDLMGHPDS